MIINSAKFTGRTMKAALSKYLAYRKGKKQNCAAPEASVQPCGKITMDELQKQYGEMRQIDVQDKSLRDFDRYARKYRVSYAVYTNGKGNYQIFFKAPNEANMTAAFEKYAGNKLKKEQRPSALQRLKAFQALVQKAVPDKLRNKEPER